MTRDEINAKLNTWNPAKVGRGTKIHFVKHGHVLCNGNSRGVTTVSDTDVTCAACERAMSKIRQRLWAQLDG